MQLIGLFIVCICVISFVAGLWEAWSESKKPKQRSRYYNEEDFDE